MKYKDEDEPFKTNTGRFLFKLLATALIVVVFLGSFGMIKVATSEIWTGLTMSILVIWALWKSRKEMIEEWTE